MVAAAVLAPAPAAAADFFVSSSTGDDAAAGTDAAHAWRSFTHLSNNISLAPGDTVNLAAGDQWNEPLNLNGIGAGCAGTMRGYFESLQISNTSVVVIGWVVDPLLPQNGTDPVAVRILLNDTSVFDTFANVSRPDLVPAGVAPNPQHGLVAALGADVVAALRHGVTRVRVMASGAAAGCGAYAWALPPNGLSGLNHSCVCDGMPCRCQLPNPAAAVRVVPFDLPSAARGHSSNSNGTASVAAAGRGLRGLISGSSDAITLDTYADTTVSDRAAAAQAYSSTRPRPSIRLNGSGTGVTVRSLPSVFVSGLEITSASAGISAFGLDPSFAGDVTVQDCALRDVWNRSSVGQTDPAHAGRDCTNGWTPAVQLGDFFNATVANCLFDNVDMAFWPAGTAVATANFIGNTVQHANGNTVMMIGATIWEIRGNVFSRNDAPRFFMCGACVMCARVHQHLFGCRWARVLWWEIRSRPRGREDEEDEYGAVRLGESKALDVLWPDFFARFLSSRHYRHHDRWARHDGSYRWQ
jgi:hypothetical protein